MKKHTLLIFTLSFFIFSSAQSIEIPQPGNTVSSPTNAYTIVQELGEGVFGKVFKVEDASGEPFAMKWYKEIPEDMLDGNPFFTALADVEREFELGQTFDHANILKSIELFSDEDQTNHFLILEFVQGKTVYQTPRRSLEKEQSLKSSSQLVHTLNHALELGYVYLDLHSNNLMISESHDLMIIDLAGFFSKKELLDLFQIKARGGSVKNYAAQKFGPKRAAILNRFIEEYSTEIEETVPEWVHRMISDVYFERITNGIVQIQSKADVDRDEKIEQRARIKKLAWEYTEDALDGIATDPLNTYLDQLLYELQN